MSKNGGLSMKRIFTLILCAFLAVGGCVSPAFAVESDNESSVNQTEDIKERRAQYISYYTEDIPAGSVSDYKDDKKTSRGNVEWDVIAINATVSTFASIIAEPFGAPWSLFLGNAGGAVIQLQSFITERAPQSKDCTYVMTTYRNDKISTLTSEYYMHSIV